MQGYIVVNKPKGMTSNAVLTRIKRHMGIKKAGHLGTLDPDVSGVLPVFLDDGTKFISDITGKNKQKAYRGTFIFGTSFDTDDCSGKMLSYTKITESIDILTERLQTCIHMMQHQKIKQKVPLYSAVKDKGARLYDIARKTDNPLERIAELPIKEVEIGAFCLSNFRFGTFMYDIDSFPCLYVDFEIDCGTGTYIRSIARDIGNELSCGGALYSMERTRSNGFSLEESVSLETLLTSDDPKQFLKSVFTLFSYPEVYVSNRYAQMIRQGVILRKEQLGIQQTSQYYKIYDNTKNEVAIVETYLRDETMVKPHRVIK